MNQTEYKIELVRGHILVTDDRGTTVLLDTGSPLSFHRNDVVALGGETFGVPTSLMGTDCSYVTDNVGIRVDGLIGMDILAEGVLIDVPGGSVVLGHPTDGMTRVPSRPVYGYMSADMDIRGRRATVIIDTGAPTSYVSTSLTEGLEAVDTVEDFNPSVPGGTFTTPIYEFPAAFAGEGFTMRAGTLPLLMRATLPLLGVDGVVGMELLRRRPVLMADGGVWICEEPCHED